MADELTLSTKFSFTKNSTTMSIDMGALSIDVAGSAYIHHRQSVGHAADEALELGDVSAVGYCIMVNRDGTNYVTVRPADDGVDLIRILPGEFAVFRLDADSATAPFVQANTAAVEIEYVVLEA